jgi:hypothetical protein
VFLSHSHNRERLWNPVEHMLGTVWAVTALALLISFAIAGLQRRAAAPGDDSGERRAAAPGDDAGERQPKAGANR